MMWGFVYVFVLKCARVHSARYHWIIKGKWLDSQRSTRNNKCVRHNNFWRCWLYFEIVVSSCLKQQMQRRLYFGILRLNWNVFVCLSYLQGFVVYVPIRKKFLALSRWQNKFFLILTSFACHRLNSLHILEMICISFINMHYALHQICSEFVAIRLTAWQ